MKKKEIKITEKEQRVAVDILQELEIWMMNRSGNSDTSESEQQIYDIFNRMFKKYRLSRDMFTGMCCTDREYERSVIEYYRQEQEDLQNKEN